MPTKYGRSTPVVAETPSSVVAETPSVVAETTSVVAETAAGIDVSSFGPRPPSALERATNLSMTVQSKAGELRKVRPYNQPCCVCGDTVPIVEDKTQRITVGQYEPLVAIHRGPGGAMEYFHRDCFIWKHGALDKRRRKLHLIDWVPWHYLNRNVLTNIVEHAAAERDGRPAKRRRTQDYEFVFYPHDS